MDYIGIDISKKSFTVAFSSAKNSRVDDYENSPKGIRKFIKRLPHDTICVMEATGNYSTLLVYMLMNLLIP